MTQTISQAGRIFYPWAAYQSKSETTSILDAVGRIAATTIRRYPPGIPEVIPGMTYTAKTVENLTDAINSDVDLIGLNPSSIPTVNVLSELPEDSGQLEISTIESRETSEKTTNEIADFFREGFSGAPYFHFAFHESNPLKPLPHNLDFAAYTVSSGISDEKTRTSVQNSLIDLAVRENFAQASHPNTNIPVLPRGFYLWTEKNICRERIKDRLSDAGYVTLVRERSTKELKGLLHARMGTIERLFHTEEWSDPHIFSSFTDPNFEDGSQAFFEKVEYHFGLRPSNKVMTISAQILANDVQGGETFYKMMRSMARRVSPQHTRLPLLCEIPEFGTAHTLNTAFTNRILFGVIKNAHPLVFSEQTSQALFPFISEKMHWHHALRRAVRHGREYRTKYYISHPSDNENVCVRPNGELGLAVFATKDISKNSKIAIFNGETYRSKSALDLPAIMRDHAVQIGEKEFLFGYKGLAHRICHSCDPNCGVRNLTEIFTVKDIAAGEQITWDYRCTENSNWILENCLCGSERCTQTVGNYDSLPDPIKAEYLKQGMVSEWLISTK